MGCVTLVRERGVWFVTYLFGNFDKDAKTQNTALRWCDNSVVVWGRFLAWTYCNVIKMWHFTGESDVFFIKKLTNFGHLTSWEELAFVTIALN